MIVIRDVSAYQETQKPSPDLVRFDNVTKTYDGHTAVVDKLDLFVREGEFLSLLGPSGSGKTTTLMMLAGFEEPTSGEITLAGQSLTRVPPHRRDIGMVFQDYALFPHMSVAENLAYPLRLRRRSRAEIKTQVEQALDMVNLKGFGQRRPTALSGGQKQRVAVARALIFQPRLILMDEPLGALDRQLREQLQVEIKQLHRRLGVTIIYVTHDQGEALTLSDRVALFHQGRIEQLGSPRDLYERPDTAFVAGFLGDNNLIPATVLTTDAETCQLRLGSGQVFSGRPAAALKAGDPAHVAIRPEAIRACSPDEPGAAPAEVLEAFYTGDQLRIRCSAFGVDTVLVKVSSGSDRPHFHIGQKIGLAIGVDAVRALPGQAGK
ncbi:ABC transporter ATP-binding protein [Mesorhizobium sp. CO1-1-8]|uniref:ABC transporter ATP-binding protein n=1 Tax=Mesorhizobium sp. CO1-1-8 TaxID=2876631 RepID=UPI001CD13D72|nr:ABC transporter ATP-binding protein [Mesorhizobium sp. CO1-1-8]MBZ9772199.1 ABC transporter ATP-binding protein [Mesorhizobium sp. CO1-1-8]